MHKILTFAPTLVVVCLASVASASDPTGNWKSTVALHGQQLEARLQLRLDSEGPHLSGTQLVAATDRSVEIANTSCRGGKIAFTATHEIDGQRLVFSYSGRIEGNAIRGQVKVDFGERSQMAEWVAVRQ